MSSLSGSGEPLADEASSGAATWWLYLVRTRQGALYTGIATDVERRFEEHRSEAGAKYLRSKGPLELVYRCALGDRGLALRAELRVKKLSKAAKERLVERALGRSELLELCGIEPPGA